ncbi:MAG: NADH-quinone oxidoreductase subunit M [Bacteroidetes bacterium]|nr:MAG: NADH-quinone oxidoreductase subunit M [Bacteroidota bacterium]
MNSSLLLNLSLFLPLLGIPLILLLPRQSAKVLALVFSLLTLVCGALLYASFPGGAAGTHEVEFLYFAEAEWFTAPGFDISFAIGVDGVSSWLLVLAALIFPVLVLFSWKRIQGQEKLYYLLLLLLQTGVLGYFVSLDLLLMYVFFEMVLIPTVFLIGIWGGAEKQAASLKFFVYTLVGSLLMLVSIIYLGVNATGEGITTDYFVIRQALEANASGVFPIEVKQWLFLGFFISFAIKTPLFPLHTWQPAAYSQSSLAGAVVMGALLSKMGTYGFIRFCIELFPEVSASFAPWIGGLAVISIIYGAYLATQQKEVRQVIAYSSLSHLGFIVLGIFAFSGEAMSGAVLQMTAHGVSTAALFLLAEMMYERSGSREISAHKGLAAGAPVFAFLFVFTVMASVGLPGLSGFVGEFLILIGSFGSAALPSFLTVIGTLGVVLAAVYLLNLTRKMWFGPAEGQITDLKGAEVALLLPFVILMLWIGLNATPFQLQINPGTQEIVRVASERASLQTYDDESAVPGTPTDVPAPVAAPAVQH